jgi:hypothetical protein
VDFERGIYFSQEQGLWKMFNSNFLEERLATFNVYITVAHKGHPVFSITLL